MSECHFTVTSNGPYQGLPRHLKQKLDLQSAALEARTNWYKRLADEASVPPPVAPLRESAAIELPDVGSLLMDQMGLYGPLEQQWSLFAGMGRSERRDGNMWPWMATEQHLDWLRSASRLVAGYNNGHGSGIIGGYCGYVIGKGMVPKLTPKDGTNDPRDQQLVEAAEEELEEFSTRVAAPELQQQSFCGSIIDGDRALWLFDMGDHVDVRVLFGEYIRAPVGGDPREWGYGVHTHAEDAQRALGYHVMEPWATEGHYVEASEIVYLPFWRPGGWERGIRRGIPFFMGANKEVIDASAKILRNMGIGVAVREAFAYMATVAEGYEREPQADAIDFAADVKIRRPFNGQPDRPVSRMYAGKVEYLPEGWAYNPPPGHAGTDAAINAVDGMIRSACAALNVPPWMGGASGRAQGAYAAELVKESPLVKTGEQRQEFYGNRFLQMYRKVLEVAVRCGRLRPETLTRLRLTMEHPSLEAQNKGEKASRDQTYVGMGAKSIQQVQREENLDPDVMRADISEFNKWKAQEAAKNQAMQGGQEDPGKVPPLTPGIDDADSDPFGEVSEQRGVWLTEAGFTGVKTYSTGAKHYYQDGKHISSPSDSEKAAIEAARTDDPPGDIETKIIGKGSSGEVRSSGGEVWKAATRDEAKVYQQLSGVDGISPSREENGQIVTPHYKNIISVDDVPRERRKSMGPIVAKSYGRLVNAITALSEAGYDYNDPLQVGYDAGRTAHLFDFSAANKVPREEAIDANLQRLSAFLGEFGAERQAKAVSHVNQVFRAMQDPDNPFMESEPETADAKRVLAALDGKPAKFLYYSGNARTIPDVAQSESRDGIVTIASAEPLSDEFMQQWEIKPVVHSTTGGIKESLQESLTTLPLLTWAERLERASLSEVTAWAKAVGADSALTELSETLTRRVLGDAPHPLTTQHAAEPIDLAALVESVASAVAAKTPAAPPTITIAPAPVMSRETTITRGPDGLVASVVTRDVLEDASGG